MSILQLSDLPHGSWLGLVEVVSLAKALKLLAELQSESSAREDVSIGICWSLLVIEPPKVVI